MVTGTLAHPTPEHWLSPSAISNYLLYAGDEEVIAVAWSAAVLEETVEHLIENVAAFIAESG
ncbi:MAG: hypothetical protein ACQERF_12765, partial [Actinomycetota bacterium]